MARPKKKSSLVDGIAELVESIRSIEAKLDMLTKLANKKPSKRGPGRPPKKKSRGRPAKKSGHGRGRPPGSKNKKKK